jgi:hypothetical protein
VKGGGTLSRADWRRQNVDRFVEQLYTGVKAAKPWVKFGISPFGIWRPGYPEQVAGFDAYEQLYADSRKWLANGWVDYFTPQLYWPIGAPRQSYPVLLAWWVEQNARGRHIWPGNYTSGIDTANPRSWTAGEVLDQISATRARPGATGNVHFSMKALMENRGGVAEQLAERAYATPALVPASPWLSRAVPLAPTATLRTDSLTGAVALELAPAASTKSAAPWLWVVRARAGGAWSTTILPGTQRRHSLAAAAAEAPDLVVISAVSRTGNEGATVTIRRGEQEE